MATEYKWSAEARDYVPVKTWGEGPTAPVTTVTGGTTAQQQAARVGVTSPIDPSYAAAVASGASYMAGGGGGSLSTSSGGSGGGSSPVATRPYFEQQGYKVEYLPDTGNIRVYDPKSGHSANIQQGAYTEAGGTSSITPDVARQIEQEIASGKYMYAPPGPGKQVAQPPQPPQQPRPDQLNQPLQQYSAPYEQLLRDLLAQMPKQPVLTQEQMLTQAQQYANLQVDPRQQDLKRALEQYQANVTAQQQAIEAAYATVPQRTQQMLDEARRYALENTIARGGGRSGAVNWAMEKATTPIMTQAQQAETQKAAAITGLQQQFGLQQTQAQTQQHQLEETRGNLTQQYLQQLQQQGYINSTQDWQNAWNASAQMASMALGAQQWDQTFDLNMLNAMTQGQLPWTPKAPAATSPVTAPVPAPITNDDQVAIRNYVQSLGGTVTYDPVTGEVIINGQRIRPSAAGGSIQGGTSYAPASYLNQLLGVG